MIQFFHLNKDSIFYSGIECTLAINTPTKSELEKFLENHLESLYLPVGITVKSPKDVFIKKIGREESLKNIQSRECFFDNLSQDGTKHVYRFRASIAHARHHFIAHLIFTTVLESDNVQMITAEIYL